jgi:hypothetical protein
MARNRKPTTRPPRRRPAPPSPRAEHEREATCAIEHVREVGTGALEARLALAELVDIVEAIRAVWANAPNAPLAAELRSLLGDVGETASKSGAALHDALSRCERYLAGGPHLHLDVVSGDVTEP